MNFFKTKSPPSRVPTLTEVVDFAPPAAEAAEGSVVATPSEDPRPSGSIVEDLTGPKNILPIHFPIAEPNLPSHDELTAKVLIDVQRQIDVMLEYRMREVLAPVVNRLTDALARDARAELALVLKEVVTRAVTEELSRRQPE